MADEWKGNSTIFKTYVIGAGKRPKEKVKGRDHIHDWDDVQDEKCFGAILNSNFVDISFDTKEAWEIFLDMAEQNEWRCLGLPSEHGGHSYWKQPKDHKVKGSANAKLAVGFIADIHYGATYIPLRMDNKDRFPPEYDIEPDEEYQEVPEELWPVKTNIDLWGMKTGEGRNDDLFKYILILQKMKIPKETIRRILRNTNDFIFMEPLEQSELEVILRDESFVDDILPEFYEGNKLMVDVLSAYLIEKCHIGVINKQLHIYQDGVYVPGQYDIERKMIEVIPGLKSTGRRETVQYLMLNAPVLHMSDPYLIAFNNGVYDLKTNTLQSFSPEYVITNKIPWDYVPDIYDELADNTLNKLACGDKTIRALLEECVGSCLFRSSHLAGGKAFILTGNGANGKSTFLDWIRAALGHENYSSLDLKEIGDRFSTSMVFGKLANIGDDISDDFLQGSQVSIFKKVVTGNMIKAENKGYQPYDFEPYCTLIFSANDIPRMKDKSSAIMRRLEIIPFNNTFKKTDPDHNDFLKMDLEEPERIEYLLAKGIEGLRRVVTTGDFTQSEQVENELHTYEEENNPILAFIKDFDNGDHPDCPDESLVGQSVNDIYLKYSTYCDMSGFSKMAKTTFSKQLGKVFGLKSVSTSISGKHYRIYTRK